MCPAQALLDPAKHIMNHVQNIILVDGLILPLNELLKSLDGFLCILKGNRLESF